MERIFAKSNLRSYWEVHAETEQYLKTWYDTAMSSDWKSPNDVKQTYANASILKDSRIVFNKKATHIDWWQSSILKNSGFSFDLLAHMLSIIAVSYTHLRA